MQGTVGVGAVLGRLVLAWVVAYLVFSALTSAVARWVISAGSEAPAMFQTWSSHVFVLFIGAVGALLAAMALTPWAARCSFSSQPFAVAVVTGIALTAIGVAVAYAGSAGAGILAVLLAPFVTPVVAAVMQRRTPRPL